MISTKLSSRFLSSLAVCAALVHVAGRLQAAEEAAGNVAPLAVVTASAKEEKARAVVDGKVPAAGCRDDTYAWNVAGNEVPATLTFAWNEPTPIATVVYYGRTTWGFELFKDYEIYVDDAATPLCKGTFQRGHGPQPINLPQPVRARKLTLKFLSGDGNPGASEVQIFTAAPPPEALLCRFTDFKLDLRYAYFPSHNLVCALVPTPPADAKEWHLAVRPADSDKILAERGGALPMAAAGENLPVPDLPAGQYVLTLTLSGGAAPLIEERGFQRQHYEWENQKLGMDDVVIPPFEPLTVNAKTQTVGCVLRQHTHGGAGLWQQVTSEGHELLANPVRLEATSGGKTVAADGAGATFTTLKPTQVTGTAAWTAGPLKGTTTLTYDYDGLMQVTLRLAPTEAQIERLQLVIPLKAAEAWLMHPVTDTLRHHYAGRIPDGQGKVWNSLKVARQGLPGPFVPYIFVGGPERGICYAADNDRDWIIGRDQAALEIDRDGQTVNLRLNLIARPAKLTRERTITFALQATPAKPMPEKPYNWRRWWTTGTAPDVQDVQINFWGGNGYWGGRNFASSVYPDGKDFGFWEKLAEQRRTGKFDKEYEKQWFDRFANLPADTRAQIEPAMRAGLQWSSYTPAITPETTKFRYVIPYTNPRGCSAEDRDFLTTYIDEWQTVGIADPTWTRRSAFEHTTRINGFGVWYQIEPVATRIDMLLFYHKKMYETFADGIYWDNFFLQPCYVPAEAGGPGYVDDDGNPRPGVNLMGFRNLVKRNAVMMHQMGKRPLSYIHMTNTNIVPMLAFGTLNLDWEWRDQGAFAKQDLQDRLGTDADTGLILAQSLGLESGNISVAIDRFQPPKDSGISREWLFRTVMAICLPHEIKVYQGTGEVSFVQDQLAAFGYGQPECKVYRYWENGFPLTTAGGKAYALVLARGGKVMLAVGNYGPGQPQAQPAGANPATPSLAEYDAAQRKGDKGGAETAAAGSVNETYVTTLTLDLKALGLPETARAVDVELKAGRKKAVKVTAVKRPEPSGETADLGKKPDASNAPAPSSAGNTPAELKRVAPGVFELRLEKHDFALLLVE